jgi:4-hydroxy-tetrahydrodipicolinate synthase
MKITGIIAASITPLKTDYSPDLEAIPKYLSFLASRGCHGALLLGTTGEGPSFSSRQRVDIFKAAVNVRQDWPEFKLLAGTGTPSLNETINLNQSAFEIGMDGVVLLPPFYFRDAQEDGLFTWYDSVINNSVPDGGVVIGYHIPKVSGVELSLELLSRLRDTFPAKFIGLKDSSSDEEHARKLAQTFGNDLQVFTGSDRLFSLALKNGASGCITAAANLISPDLRELWETFHAGKSTKSIQERVDYFRNTTEKFPPFPPLIKFLLSRIHGFPEWPVCPPLMPVSEETKLQVSRMLELA